MALLIFPGRTNRAVKVLAARLFVVQLELTVGQLVPAYLGLKITNNIIIIALLATPALSQLGGAALVQSLGRRAACHLVSIMKQRHLQMINLSICAYFGTSFFGSIVTNNVGVIALLAAPANSTVAAQRRALTL